ncbi:hypothetical protein [Streptomyces sp. 7N604]|uniref:hypothetical protein n=1 Tax=Streptomyces sp. 7N604 TaxID=3457415 RepID=UPI003FD2E2DC
MLRDWCSWHEGYAEGTKLVKIVETGSGPGGMLYACGECRVERGLTPLVDEPPPGRARRGPPRTGPST